MRCRDERVDAGAGRRLLRTAIAARRLLVETGRYDALVALGVVVRGETPHFDFVAGECARGIMDVQLEARVPIGFGVLTTDTLEQAVERADPGARRQGSTTRRVAARGGRLALGVAAD